MPDKDKRKALYDAVSKDYDLGSYDDFSAKMDDSTKRKAFYNGVGKEYELGDYNSFESNVSIKKKDSGIASPPSSATTTPTTSGSKPFLPGSSIVPEDKIIKMPGLNMEDIHATDEDPVKTGLAPLRNEHRKALNEFQNITPTQVAESTGQKVNPDRILRNGNDYKTTVKENVNKSLQSLEHNYDQLNNTIFPTAKAAADYIQQKADKNNGQLPEDNETVQLAGKRISDYKNTADEILNTNSIADAAINNARKNDPELDKQIGAVMAANHTSNSYEYNVPEVLYGKLVSHYLENKDVKEFAENNPDFKEQYDDLKNNLITKKPEYGANVVANEISREREKRGMNSKLGVANFAFGHQDAMDRMAEDIYKNDPQKLKIYKDIISHDLNKYLYTPGFLDTAEGAVERGFKGTQKTVRELVGAYKDDSQRDALNEKYSTITSGTNKVSEIAGDMAGTIAYMAAGGRVLGKLGVPSGIADKAMVGFTFFGDEKSKARLKYPGDPWKQNVSAGLTTAAFMAAANVFPASKVNKAIDELRPTIADITAKLSSGNITREAAKTAITSGFEKALVGLKAAGKQNVRGITEMLAVNAVEAASDKVLGLSDRAMQEHHPDGQTLDIIKTMAIGGALPSAISGYGAMKNRSMFKEHLNQMASEPNRIKDVILDQVLTNPEAKHDVETKLDNLKHITQTKEDLIKNTTLPEKLHGDYLLHSLNEKLLRERAEKIIDPTLKGRVEEQIKKSQQIKENILKGKTTDVLPQEDNLSAKEQKEVGEIKNDQDLFDHFVSQKKEGYRTTLKVAEDMEDKKAGVKAGLDYMKDKAFENPVLFSETWGNELTKKMLDRATIQEIGDSYYNLIDKNSKDPAIPELEKILDEREAKGEVYKPTKIEEPSNEEAVTVTQPAKESAISVIKPGEIKQPEVIPLKTKEDAIQKQSADAVDVQSKAPDGEGVGSGNEKPPIPPGKEKVLEGAGEEKVTGIKNAISNVTRSERQLPKVDVPEYGSDSIVIRQGKELVDSGQVDPREVVNRVLSTKGGMQADDAKAMQYYMHQLASHEKDLRTQYEQADTPEGKAEVSGRLQQLSDEVDAATQANIIAGKSWSDVGNIRQIQIDDGFNPSREKATIKDAYGGELPKDVEQRINGITKERDEALAQLNKVEEQLREKMAKESVEKVKKDAAKTSKRQQKKEELKKEEEDLLKELKKSIKKDMNNLHGGIPIPKETLETISKLLVNYVKQGINSLEGLVDKLHTTLKEDIPELTKKQVRDLVVQYKETEKLNKTAARKENELKPTILDSKGKPREPKDFAKTDIPKEKLKFRDNTEWVKAQQRVANAEFKLRVEKRKAYESQKNFFQRGLMWAGRLTRLSVLSGYNVLGKLAAAATIGSAAKRIPEQAIGAVYSQIFKGVAEKAPIEGYLNAKAEAKFYKDFFNPKKFIENSWSILRTGESNLSKRFGAGQYEHIPLLYLPTDLHQIIKDPVKRATFEASFHNGMVWAEKNGLDINDPLVINSIETAAYKRGNYEIFQEQNWLSRKFTAWKNQMEKSGNVGATGKFVADFMIPVSTVPTNIVRRLITTSPLGLIRGGKDVVNAYRKGIENLKPDEADAVMKQLKQGSLGTALWMIGWFGSGYFGGLYSKYNPDKKRKEGELAHDEMSIDGKMIPKPVQHALPLEVIQWAATARHIYDNYSERKKSGNFEAIKNAGFGSIGALLEQVPVIETGVHMVGAANNEYEGNKFMDDVKRRFEPQILRETGVIKKDDKKKKK